MTLNELTPVSFQAQLKTPFRSIPADVLAISQQEILIAADSLLQVDSKMQVLISGDFPLSLEVQLVNWMDSGGDDGQKNRIGLFQFCEKTKDQEENLKRMIDYFSRLRKAGVRWQPVPSLRAKAV